MEWNIIDVIIGAILAYAGYRGFKNGFVVELATLVALLFGVWGAVEFSEITAELIKDKLNWNPDQLGLIAFIVTFILIVIGIHIIAKAVSKLLDAVALGILNRIAGMIFGALKFVFIISVVLMIVARAEKLFEIIPQETKNNSLLYKPVEQFAPNILPFFKFDEAGETISSEIEKSI